MRAILLSLILLSSGLVTAQTGDVQHQKDSLRSVIAATEGEDRFNAYRKLHYLYIDDLSDNASLDALFGFAKEYTKYAQQEDNIKLQGDIMINNLVACMRMNRFDEVEKRASQTLDFLKKNGMSDGFFVAYKQLILAYCRQGFFEKALDELQVVYREAKERNDSEAQFYMQYLMGVTYMHQDRLGEAEDYYRKSIETAEKMSKKPFGMIIAYQEVCNMLQATERFDDFFVLAKQTETLIEQLEKENPNTNHIVHKKNLWTLYAYAYDAKGEFDRAEHYCDLIDGLSGSDIVSQGNTFLIRAHIAEAREEYAKALEYINRAIEIDPTHSYTRFTKVKILSRMENAPLTWAEAEAAVACSDSLRNAAFNAQLDELRTQYDVDKHIAEKERNRNNFLFALAGCLLLAAALGIRIYYNRQITGKNRVLAQQIRELTAQQELRDAELLNQTSFMNEEYLSPVWENNDGFCPESRKDKLCVAIRDFILRDKAYRNPCINRDYVIEHLGTNRELFVEAFMYCFGMSFSEYINSLRLKDAVTLLEQSDLSIEDISEKTGFGTVRTFQRQFRTKYNMSPKEYRKLR